MNVAKGTLYSLAGVTWLCGAVSLLMKGVQLLFSAAHMQPSSLAPWYAAGLGIGVGFAKDHLVFTPSCQRNLTRIDALQEPRLWQFFRGRFIVALALMILAGVTLSRLAMDHFHAQLAVGALDLSISTALFLSGRHFLAQVQKRSLFAGLLILSMAISTIFLISLHGLEHQGQLSPFTSDGCSRFPDGPFNAPNRWRDCCVMHDRAYWLGGTYTERIQADDALRRCIEQVENPALAEAMWAGVRVGGSPFWPSTFRWGYGWPYGRGYRSISAKEREISETLPATE